MNTSSIKLTSSTLYQTEIWPTAHTDVNSTIFYDCFIRYWDEIVFEMTLSCYKFNIILWTFPFIGDIGREVCGNLWKE